MSRFAAPASELLGVPSQGNSFHQRRQVGFAPPVELPNILDLLKKPRASLPPVDFNLLAAPIKLSSGRPHPPSTARSGNRRQPDPSGSLSARPSSQHNRFRSQHTHFWYAEEEEEEEPLRLHSTRVPLRTRRRAAALGDGAHTLAVHELLRRGASGNSSRPGTTPHVPVVAVWRSFRSTITGPDGRPHSPPRLANVGALFGGGTSRGSSARSGGRGGESRPMSRGSSRSIKQPPARPGTATNYAEDVFGLEGTMPEAGSAPIWGAPPAPVQGVEVEGGGGRERRSSGPEMGDGLQRGDDIEDDEDAAEPSEVAPASSSVEPDDALGRRVVRLTSGKAAADAAARKTEKKIAGTFLPADLADSMRENVRSHVFGAPGAASAGAASAGATSAGATSAPSFAEKMQMQRDKEKVEADAQMAAMMAAVTEGWAPPEAEAKQLLEKLTNKGGDDEEEEEESQESPSEAEEEEEEEEEAEAEAEAEEQQQQRGAPLRT